MRTSHQRRSAIARRLVEQGSVVVGELAAEFGVSRETIRNDLEALEKVGVAQRTHGGAVHTQQGMELPWFQRDTLNADVKLAIAKAVVDLIQSASTIVLDSGSTTHLVAKLLSLREEITVITPSMSVVSALSRSPGIAVIVPGGELRQITQGLVGPWAAERLRQVDADVAVLGANSIAHVAGPATTNLQETAVKQAMLTAARRTVLAVDSSKALTRSTYIFAEWRAFDAVVTDNGLPPEVAHVIEQHTELILTDQPSTPSLGHA